MPWAYLLRCADGSLYGGAAQDLAARLGQHERGRASRYTRARLPVALAWTRALPTWGEALREEIRVKALPRAAKEELAGTDAVRCTLLRPSSYRAMPWKNGRGVTTEIARRPAGDGAFDWRLSTALVEEAGPFSPFPGQDRVLVVLEGDGLELTHEGSAPLALPPLEPHAFSGDTPTSGRPLGGPVRDFNVIWARDRSQVAVDVLRRTRAVTVPLAPESLFHAARGAARVVVPGAELELGPGETLLLDTAAAAGAVVRPRRGAVVICVAMAPCYGVAPIMAPRGSSDRLLP